MDRIFTLIITQPAHPTAKPIIWGDFTREEFLQLSILSNELRAARTEQKEVK